MKALGDAGVPKQQVAERPGLSRATVTTWLAAEPFPERAARLPARVTLRSAYTADIAADDDGGRTNAAAVARQLRPRG